MFGTIPKDRGPSTSVPCGIHYGFQQATGRFGVCSHITQQHSAILSEEAGKFMGRHRVLIRWTGDKSEVATEKRQLTVRNMRGTNRSLALWIDFVSELSSTGGTVRLEDPLGGLSFVAPVDHGTTPEYLESTHWKALVFDFEGTTYTAVWFNHPDNPTPLIEKATDERRTLEQTGPQGLVRRLGYRFSTEFDEQTPLRVHYRFWIQGGVMPTEEIRSMSNNFLQPIQAKTED
jgi:hypothetical protein